MQEANTFAPINQVQEIGFFLVPDFSFIGFSSAIEPLRAANRVSDETLYSWTCYSLDGEPVTSSNGVSVNVDGTYSDLEAPSMVVIVGGNDIQNQAQPKLISKLRQLSSHGAAIGAVCTGSHILAKAGLLDGYKCTIHWEILNGFAEEFPDIEVTNDLFEIDRNRLSCAGGTSALDMMMHLIDLHYGPDMASLTADMLIHHRIRDGDECQRMALRVRLGVSHPKLLAVISHMESTLEEPLSCSELADKVDLSTRQLERLFQKYLRLTPTRYYLELRLRRARFLLLQTSMSIIDVALASGFVSASHFSKSYREFLGHTPSEERRAKA